MVAFLPLLPDTGHVKLSILDGGSWIGYTAIMHAGVRNETFRMYNWSFFVTHPGSGQHVLWDIGMSEQADNYTPRIQKTFLDPLKPAGARKSYPEQLATRNINSTEINKILFSHAHHDHCRPIKDEFPNATGYFGPGTKAYCAPGHFRLDIDQIPAMFDGRFFDPEKATERWEELSGPWVQFGAFPCAMDLFGDGSFWVIQAPGHMPGNLCAAARLQSGDWVMLGSDCCHSRPLYEGAFEYATDSKLGGIPSLHTDLAAAKETIARIRLMEKHYGVHVAFAHDSEWMKEGKDKVLMSLMDAEFEEFARSKLPWDRPF